MAEDTDTALNTGQSLDALVGGMPKPDYEGAAKQLGDVKRKEITAKESIYDQQSQTIEAGRAEAHRKYEGISAIPDKEWNADEERSRRVRNPMENFGSFATVFAMAASAFTHRPAINALTAGAAAMTAMRANDMDAYDKAYDAWKENTNLALKRHHAQREAFDDSIKLWKTDLGAAQEQARVVAERFGDQKALVYIENGMFPELVQYKEGEAKAAKGIADAQEKIEKVRLQKEMLELDPDYYSQDPLKKREAIRRATEGERTPEQDAYSASIKENPDMSSAERRKILQEIKQFGHGSGGATAQRHAQLFKEAVEDAEKKKGEPLTPKEKQDIQNKVEGRGGITGNQMLKEQAHIDQIDLSIDKIGAAKQFLDKYVGGAGVAGMVTRKGETVANMLGASNQTDRRQFESDMAYLQMVGTRLLSGSQGRPLSKEEARIATIIRGLNFGDTTANTQRALDELNSLYNQMRRDGLTRLQGDWQPRDREGGGSETKGSAKPRWMDAPVVQP